MESMTSYLTRLRALRPIAAPAVALALFFAMSWQCTFPDGEPVGNTPPDTRLANVPANDTIGTYILQGVIPEQTLYWAGDDPDGYVVAYRFRWIDYTVPRPETTQFRTVLNLTSLAAIELDTLIEVSPYSTSPYRVYNYFATIGASASLDFLNALTDSIAKGTWFPVPYGSGFIPGDSVRGANPVQLEAPTKGSFIFGSTADSNQHRFEVKAVDNTDVEDPTPAFVHFWTLRSPGPIILDILGASTSFARYLTNCPTERNPGITFTATAIDRSTLQREYSWAIDDTSLIDPQNWSPWNRLPTFTATAAMLRPTGSDTHRVYVRARNRWGVISPIYGEPFRAVRPEIDDPNWPKRLLVVINNKLLNGVGYGGALDSTVTKDHYAQLLDAAGMAGKYDFFVRVGGNPDRWPLRSTFAKYTSILFVAETPISPPRDGARWVIQADKVDSLEEYLAYGGDIVWSGSQYIERYFSGGAWPTIARNIFHINSQTYRVNMQLDFLGVTGGLGYPAVAVDSVRVPADSNHALRGIGIYNQVVTFGVKTGFFRSLSGSLVFDGQPVSSQYLSPPPEPNCNRMFCAVYLGYPLYYMRNDDAVAVLQKAFTDIGAY